MTTKSFFFSTLPLLASLFFAKPTLAAPRIYLDPTTIEVKQNQEFAIPIKIDVESNTVIGSDLTLTFAITDQELIGVDNAYFFPEFTWAPSQTGKLEIHAFSSSIHQTKTGQGTLATLKFKAKKDSGSSTLGFTCTSGGNDTNILNQNGANILNCSSLNQTLITYASSTTSPSPSASPSTTPSQNTKSPTCTSLSVDPTSANTIPKTVTLTCSGYDSDSSLTGVEFVFGDGTSQTINSNLGSNGKISTTHTYTRSGKFTPTCKLKDDKFTSNECSTSLTLQTQSPTPTPKPSTSPKPSLKAGAYPTATPPGKVLSLVAEATPSPSPTISPTPSPAPKSSITPKTLWLTFLFVIFASLGVYIVIRLIRATTVDIPPQSL